MVMNYLIILPFALIWVLLVGVIGYLAVNVWISFLDLVSELRDRVERWLIHRGDG